MSRVCEPFALQVSGSLGPRLRPGSGRSTGCQPRLGCPCPWRSRGDIRLRGLPRWDGPGRGPGEQGAVNWPSRQRGGRRAGSRLAWWAQELRSPKAPPAVARGPGVRSLRAGVVWRRCVPDQTLTAYPPSVGSRRRAEIRQKGHGSRAPEMTTRERAGARKWRLRRRRPGGSRGHFRFRSVAFFGCFPSARRLPSPARLSAPLPGGGAAGPSTCGPPCVRACARARLRVRRPRPGTLPVTPRPSGGRGLPAMSPRSAA